jgi:hypothetical protein
MGEPLKKFVRFGPSAAAYLVAMAVQLSGYTNGYVAVVLFCLATGLLLIPAWPYIVSGYSRFVQLFTRENWKPSLAQGLYVGCVHVDLQYLASDYYIEFALRGFNGTGREITISDVRGNIVYEVIGSDPPHRAQLPPPVIRDDTHRRVRPYGEFFVIIIQRVPGNIAASIVRALSDQSKVQLSLSSLDVRVHLTEAPGDSERLPVWDGVTCEQVTERVFIGRVVSLSAVIRTASVATVR